MERGGCCLKNRPEFSAFLEQKGHFLGKWEHYNGMACFQPPRNFLPVGYLLCNDKAFLLFTCWVSGTVVVVVVYSIIYIKKEENSLPNIHARHDQTTQDMMFRYVLGTSLEHAAFLEHLEHGVATEYKREYVRKENASQVTQNAWLRGYACVVAWVHKSHQFPQHEAKREYVPEPNEYQDVQTQKSPHEAGAKKPQLRGLIFPTG